MITDTILGNDKTTIAIPRTVGLKLITAEGKIKGSGVLASRTRHINSRDK